MDEIEYLKCACKECGTHLEYPAHASGTTVTCPNCGQWTELPGTKAPVERKGLTINLVWIGLICCVALWLGALWWWLQRQPTVAEKPPPPAVKVAANPATNASAMVVMQAVVAVPAKPKPKSHDDLHVSEIELERTPNTTLVYAVGVVTNASDWQRFGVRIELDLLNAQEKKIGETQDYKEILEPHQAWQFRAMIHQKKAVSAKLSALTEQE
jgi:ribosomal protein S27E